MRKKLLLFVLMPTAIVLLLTLSSYSSVFEKIEGSIYNATLALKKDINEHPDILLVDFGDQAIKVAETYPVSRSIYADGIFLLKELGTKYTVFDIEFIDPSPVGVNQKTLNQEVPEFIDREFSSITKNTSDLFAAVSDGSIPLQEVSVYLPELASITDRTKNDVINRIQSIVRNNDEYLGAAAKIFENTFLTININPGTEDLNSATYNYFKENYSIKNIEVVKEYPNLAFTGALPTLLTISKNAKGAGFTNVIIDPDGVRRKIELIRNIDGVYYGQLAFRPLLDWLGNPDMKLEKNQLTLYKPNVPGKGVIDIMEIPLNSDGSFNINWVPKSFVESFKHIPFEMLMNHDKLYDIVVKNLKERADWGYLNAYRGQTPFLDIIYYLENERASLFNSENPEIESYVNAKDFLLTELSSFINDITATNLLNSLEELKNGELIADSDYQIIKKDIPVWFKNTGEALEALLETRNLLKEKVNNSFALIGNTATGTTDIGVNPFEERYMNVGTHANVANTILNQSYIKLLPKWIIILTSFFLCILLTLIIKDLPPKRSIFIGIISLTLIVSLLIIFFRLTSTYIELLFPSLSILITFILLTSIRFLSSEKEKSFINKAFSHYLSADVIKEILDDPSKLKLGGELKYMTAMFTDVKGFSTFSEKLTPQDLVRLLNAYLTEMSNTVMEQKGTIDKYEGDAIISFFGAPVYFEDHAYRCCLSAVIMKRVEKDLNKKFIDEKWTEDLVLTRKYRRYGCWEYGY